MLPYIKYLVILIFLIIIAQTLSYAKNENALNREMIVNYGRLVFNVYTFFISAFLVYRYGKQFLTKASWAIFISSFVVLPVYWDLREGVYVSGGRLAGYLQTPIVFGLWTMVALLIGLGLVMNAKKLWQRALLTAWLSVIASFLIWSSSRGAWLAMTVALVFTVGFYIFRDKNLNKAGTYTALIFFSFFVGYLLLPTQQLKIQPFVAERAANLATSIATLHPAEIKGQSHVYSWPVAIKFISQNPLGFGFGAYASKQLLSLNGGRTPTSNSFLELALYGGVAALFTFLGLLYKIGASARGALQKLGSATRNVTLFWIAAGLAIVIAIFFTDGFLWRHVWFVLGMVAGISLDRSESQKATASSVLK